MLFHHLNSIHLFHIKLNVSMFCTLSSQVKLWQYSVVNLVFGSLRYNNFALAALSFANMFRRYIHTHTILNTHVVFPSIFMLVSSTRQIFISVYTNFSINEKLFYGLAAFWSDGLNFRFGAVVTTAAAANRFWPVSPVCHVIVSIVCMCASFRAFFAQMKFKHELADLLWFSGHSIIFHVSSFPFLLPVLLLAVCSLFLSRYARFVHLDQ